MESSGYTRLYRKFWNNELLRERGKSFSKREAWLYIVNVLARGVDGDDLKRGEFEASYRYLSKAWRWDTAKVFRFFRDLIAQNMLEKVKQQMKQLNQHQLQRFIVCEYDTYNPLRNSNCNSSRNSNCNKLNKRQKKVKESKDNIVPNSAQNIFEYWKSKPELMNHRKLSKTDESHLNAALEQFTEPEIKTAIDHYATVLQDETGQYWLNQKWTIGEFVSRKSHKWLMVFNSGDWENQVLSTEAKKAKQQEPDILPEIK